MISLYRLASLFAFGVGALSVFAGSMVLRGWRPGYQIVSWLPVYNFVLGILTLLIPAVLLWNNSRFAGMTSLIFFVVHAVVTGLLLLKYRDIVATQSLLAMSFRLVVWVIILLLVYFSSR